MYTFTYTSRHSRVKDKMVEKACKYQIGKYLRMYIMYTIIAKTVGLWKLKTYRICWIKCGKITPA